MSSSSFNTDDQKIEHIYETVLDHAGDWARARTTHLVCKIEGDDVPIVKTNVARKVGNVHAEKLLIDDLQGNDTVNETNGSSDLSEVLKKMSLDGSKKKCNDKKTKLPKLLDITIYINNSPCSDPDHNCTDRLITFLDRYRGVKLNLFVTSLYNIRRQTCRDEPHYNAVNNAVHRTNYAAVRSGHLLKKTGKTCLALQMCHRQSVTSFWVDTAPPQLAMIEVEKRRINISRMI